MKDKILFIINPVSGVGKQKIVEKAIDKFLNKDLYDYRIAYTQYAHHATEIAKQSLDNKEFTPKIIVAVGGDGSINDCVRGLVGSNAILGIIPCGSGNGLARCLHIPLNISRAIEVINESHFVNIDTVKLNGLPFVSIAGVGFDALIAEKFRGNTTRGFQTYARIALQDYPMYEPRTYRLLIDGHIITTKALFVSFSNSNQFGYNAVVAPKAVLTDGLLDVSIVKKMPLAFAGPGLIQLLFFRNFDKNAYVKTFKVKNVKLLDFEDKAINLDGECIEIQDKTLDFEIVEHSLNVIIPTEKHRESIFTENKIVELCKQIKCKVDNIKSDYGL